MGSNPTPSAKSLFSGFCCLSRARPRARAAESDLWRFHRGSAARDALATRKPDLVISDIGLPGEDGYSFIKHLRSLPSQDRIPAIAVTAFARAEDRQHVVEAGFDEHLPKPVDSDRLFAVVVKMLHH